MEFWIRRECRKCLIKVCLLLILLYFHFVSDIILDTLLEDYKIIKSLKL